MEIAVVAPPPLKKENCIDTVMPTFILLSKDVLKRSL
jgi:hypothetical protein